jgi:hypothetical protein
MVSREVCPFHADDDVVGVPTGNEDGSLIFTCDRSRGHPEDAPHIWLRVPAPPDVPGVDGLAAELGLGMDLPAALKQFAGMWVEYGLIERAYALYRPTEFARIVNEFGHNAIEPKRYTTSAFVGRALGALGRQGTIGYRNGPATGRWSYNSSISWWAVHPLPDWDAARISWQDAGHDMSYVPGADPSA